MKNLKLKVDYKAQSFFYYLYHLIKAWNIQKPILLHMVEQTNKQTKTTIIRKSSRSANFDLD